MDNHYAVLNVAMDAPDAVIRAAWRVLAAQSHPDRHGEASALRMQRINAAYRVLSDPVLRAGHDAQLRRAWRRRASDAPPAPGVSNASVPGLEDAQVAARRDADLALARRRACAADSYAAHAALR
jgi:curved DNA-binding protein CbpA